MVVRLVSLLPAVLLGLLAVTNAQTCTSSQPCKQGCCNGKTGNCGFGPDFCGSSVCISNCNATAECGQYAPAGKTNCPLNVCCSKFGFCGTTSDFCGSGCQNGCNAINYPSCGGTSSAAKYVGYYESWSPGHPCEGVTPSQIDPTPWTHLNYAFALIASDNTITQMNSYDLQYYTDFNSLKQKKPSLKTFISVGGWDAGGQVFSNMAQSSSTRAAFINSAISLMQKYGFDGIDIDWEYPSAGDRGGRAGDAANLVSLLKELRAAGGSKYLITATLPSSYWYMQGFDIVGMQQYVDWFNFMSYDIHGTWDGDNPYTQAIVQPHTNLTEISAGLSLLWRNNISPAKVALGLGFYGRSFTLKSSTCNSVGCPFSGGGSPGACTGTSGILSNYEMEDILTHQNPKTVYNAAAGVNWMTWGGNQWVSYDDGRTLAQKASFADGLCLGGLFSWALDLGGPGTLASPHDPSLANGTDLAGSTPGNGGIVYISPDIWTQPNPTVACQPPCTLVFPPKTLSSPTTISFPPYVTSLEVAWSTSYYTTISGQTSLTTTIARTIEVTTLSIPPLTTNVIPVWNWPVSSNNTNSVVYTLTSSVNPPMFTITDDPNPARQSGVSHPPVTRTITPPPYPWPSTTSGPSSSSTTAAGLLIPVHFTIGPPGPLCKSGCGSTCKIFCSGPCLLNCGGGDFPDPIDPNPPGCSGPDCHGNLCTGPHCVYGGCTGVDCHGGVCTGPKCTSGGCSGPDCVNGQCLGPSCCYGPGCVDGQCFGSSCVQGSSQDGDQQCTSKQSAPLCTETVSSTKKVVGTSTASTYSTTTITACRTLTACSIKASTTTTTITDNPSCVLYPDYTGFPFAYGADGPIISSMTIPMTDKIIITGGSGGGRTTIAGSGAGRTTGTGQPPRGTTTITTTITTTLKPTTVTSTTTVTVQPSASAACALWDEGFFFRLEVYNIQGWGGDNGADLLKQEKGCGALTGWTYNPPGQYYASAYFNLPTLIKAGCVERAIVSAGGPKLQCTDLTFAKRGLRRTIDAPPPDEAALAEKARAEEELRARAEAAELRRRAVSAKASYLPPSSTPSYSYSTTASTTAKYVPMDWTGTNNTVVLTFTLTQTDTSTYATTLTSTYGSNSTASSRGNGTAASTGTTATKTTTSTVTPLYPTQSGIAPACNLYAEAVSGDYCYKFAGDHGITTDQLYAWNPVLGAGGANCSTQFQAGYDYCVGVSTPSSTVTNPTSTSPTASAVPTQSGIASNCNKLVVAKSGDYCYQFAQDNAITTTQLYNWNTILGPGGQNCSTNFQAGYGYCVSVSS